MVEVELELSERCALVRVLVARDATSTPGRPTWNSDKAK